MGGAKRRKDKRFSSFCTEKKGDKGEKEKLCKLKICQR